MSPAGHTHGKIAARFTAALAPFVEDHGLGETYAAETGFLLRTRPDTVRAPDVAFVGTERLEAAAGSADGFFPGPPDLAVEVVSPSDSAAQVQEKVMAWLAAGVRVVVALDPSRKIAAVHRSRAEATFLSGAQELTIPELLPGWSLNLAKLFK